MSKSLNGWNEDLPIFTIEQLRRMNEGREAVIIHTTIGKCRYGINATVAK